MNAIHQNGKATFTAGAAIAKGAVITKLFDIPAREQIGRAKNVHPDEYVEAYAKMAADMTAQIEEIAAQGGEL